MKIVHARSLARTLDAVNDASFHQRPLPKAQSEHAAKWIASRQGKPESYRGVMFGPGPDDLDHGITLFTGEKVAAGRGAWHILGEEACRVLILLDGSDAGVREALARASDPMAAILRKTAAGYFWRRRPGEYCCAKCTLALWRHLAAGGLRHADPERWLEADIRALRAHRTGGRWKRFPFYYTLLALSEIDLPAAVREMRHTARECARYLERSRSRDLLNERRRLMAARVLARC